MTLCDFKQKTDLLPDDFINYIDTCESLEKVEVYVSEELEKVERSLMDEVANQTIDYFDTLNVLKIVHDSLNGLCDMTCRLKEDIDIFDERLSNIDAKLQELTCEQQNLLDIRQLLGKLSDILRGRQKIKQLIDSCCFDEARFLIDRTMKHLDVLNFRHLNEIRKDVLDMKLALDKLKSAESDINT